MSLNNKVPPQTYSRLFFRPWDTKQNGKMEFTQLNTGYQSNQICSSAESFYSLKDINSENQTISSNDQVIKQEPSIIQMTNREPIQTTVYSIPNTPIDYYNDMFYCPKALDYLPYTDYNSFTMGIMEQEYTRVITEEAKTKALNAKKQRPKKFKCPHCNVAFSNNGQLKGHIRIHTGMHLEN